MGKIITSTSNPQVRYIIQLQNKGKIRKENKEFVVEGVRMASEAPKDRVRCVYASETFVKNNSSYINKLGMPYELVSDSVFAQMSDTMTPQGIMAVVKMAEYNIESMLKASNPRIVVLENLQDPGNLGTILRTAEGAGVTGVIMGAGTVDIYNPKTIRSTMGSLYRVPFVYAGDFAAALDKLKAAGITLYAAHLAGSIDYTEADYTKPSAFLIGNEGNGLTEASSGAADMRIRIPMDGNVESLNAAVATAVLLFEARRQNK